MVNSPLIRPYFPGGGGTGGVPLGSHDISYEKKQQKTFLRTSEFLSFQTKKVAALVVRCLCSKHAPRTFVHFESTKITQELEPKVP